tara:strand:- start:269 stop:604 length:336 start_codon:yes stop_codon:yes gene_type:complete
MKRYFVIFGVVIVLMLFAARKESGRHVDIDKVEHGHIVHWHKENTTMLRSTSNATRVVSEGNETKSQDAHELLSAMRVNNFVVFHKEPNTYGCSGDCIEYAWIKLNKNFFL